MEQMMDMTIEGRMLGSLDPSECRLLIPTPQARRYNDTVIVASQPLSTTIPHQLDPSQVTLSDSPG